MKTKVFEWALENAQLYCTTGIKERVACWLILNPFALRYSLYKARNQIQFMEREAKRYQKKLDRLYMICAEYEAFNESCTHDTDKAREAAAYGE